MEIDYISGIRTTGKITGTQRYQEEIHGRLPQVGLNRIDYIPLSKKLGDVIRARVNPEFQAQPARTSASAQDGGILRKSLRALIRFSHNVNLIDRYARYPYLVRRQVKRGNIRHITFQELAYLNTLLDLGETVVTCYDLIPFVFRSDRSLHWRLNMAGMKKAGRLITISEFSRKEITQYIGFPEERIHVVCPAVDHDQFFPRDVTDFIREKNIDINVKRVLYVGSEHPRQNLHDLVRAFAVLKKRLPDVKLYKVGEPMWPGARDALLQLIAELSLENDVVFSGFVSEEELPLWYNSADLFVYPCKYTGWSLPSTEAMASGTPVITSNLSVLPEVVGDGGITVDPADSAQFADHMYSLLMDDTLRKTMIEKGFARADSLRWENAARQTLDVYEKMG